MCGMLTDDDSVPIFKHKGKISFEQLQHETTKRPNKRLQMSLDDHINLLRHRKDEKFKSLSNQMSSLARKSLEYRDQLTTCFHCQGYRNYEDTTEGSDYGPGSSFKRPHSSNSKVLEFSRFASNRSPGSYSRSSSRSSNCLCDRPSSCMSYGTRTSGSTSTRPTTAHSASSAKPIATLVITRPKSNLPRPKLSRIDEFSSKYSFMSKS